jgi:hypothetical protein
VLEIAEAGNLPLQADLTHGDGAGNVVVADAPPARSRSTDISHNAITSAASMGQVGLQWQVGGIAAAFWMKRVPLLVA